MNDLQSRLQAEYAEQCRLLADEARPASVVLPVGVRVTMTFAQAKMLQYELNRVLHSLENHATKKTETDGERV